MICSTICSFVHQAFRSDVAPKLLRMTRHEGAALQITKLVLGAAKGFKSFLDDPISEEYLRRFHLRLFGCLTAVIGSSQVFSILSNFNRSVLNLQSVLTVRPTSLIPFI